MLIKFAADTVVQLDKYSKENRSWQEKEEK